MVTLVVGPPCSGKSTYVERHQEPGDLVFDYDRFAAAIGGEQAGHRHIPGHRPFVLGAFWGAVAATRSYGTSATIWIPTGAPLGHDRRRLNPNRVVVLAVPADVCIARAKDRYGEGNYLDQYRDAIERWWREYQPDPRDEVAA